MGKIVGGTIGFALGGPLGAIAGAALGHAFDSNETVERGGQGDLTAGETSQLTFFVATFSMLAKLAGTDGRISKEEVDTVERFMLYDLNLSPRSRQMAMDIFYEASQNPMAFQDFAQQFYNHFQYRPELLEFMIDILLRLSVADGGLSASEEALITAAVRIFHMSENRYQALRGKYVQETQQHYAVLGCQPGDSDEQIKACYRKLVMEYHPDRILSKGLPEEFTAFAEQKFRQIQDAYEAIKKERRLN
jgi:DnaJ like chaperone protein